MEITKECWNRNNPKSLIAVCFSHMKGCVQEQNEDAELTSWIHTEPEVWVREIGLLQVEVPSTVVVSDDPV